MYWEATSPEFNDIVADDAVLERVSYNHRFTEGPVWNAREGSLYWTDIIGDTIWKWTPGVGREIVLHPSWKANGMTIDRQGRLVVAGWSNRSVWRMEPDGVITPLATHFEGKKINTPNDIVVKSDGAIYWTDGVGGLRNTEQEGEDLQQYLDFVAVFRLEPDSGALAPVTLDVDACNGLAFSPDESILYVNHTAGMYIQAFDVKPDGTLANSRRFADVVYGEGAGKPDGMKVDAEGRVFCTGPGGIHVFDPAGEFLGRLLVPEDVSNMAWGDEDWKTLYITARTSVYRIRLKARGIAV